jgi:hypothetical protein
MTLRRRTPFVLVVLAFAIAACSSNGEPSWSLTSSTSAGGFHGPQVEDLTGMVIDWEFAEDVDSWGDVPDDFEWGIRQIDARTLEVGWWGLGCDDDPRLFVDEGVIELTLDGYLDDRPDPEVGCAMMGIWREVRLTFTENVDVEAFTLTVIEPPS